MRTVSSRVRRGLFTLAVGSVVLGTAVPAFAAQTRVAATVRDPLADLTASQVAAKAEADFVASRSAHVDLIATAKGTTGLLLDVTFAHNACAGSTALTLYATTEFIQIGKAEWVLLTRQLMAKAGYSKADIAKYAGKWNRERNASSPFGFISCPMEPGSGFPRTGWTKGPVSIVAGQRAVELTYKAKGETLWVSDSSRPEFLKVVGHGYWAAFSRYNAKVTITPPPASEVVSVPQPPNLLGAVG